MRCPSIDPRRAITPVAAAVITLGVAASAAASAAPASLTAGAATLQPPLVVAAGERGLVVARFGRARRLATRAPAGARDVLPRWSPDGRRVAFVRVAGNGDAALRVVDVATRRERALRRGWSPAFAWAPDGTRIAVATLVRSTAW